MRRSKLRQRRPGQRAPSPDAPRPKTVQTRGGGEAVILDREERCANPHCGRRLYRKFQAIRKGDKVFCPGCTP